MSREKTRQDAQVEQWLRQDQQLPPLKDRSVEGREAFLGQYEATLWSYWSKAFSVAISDGTINPKLALGVNADNPEHSGQQIADRLISALRKKPRLDSAKAWENLEGWYAWLIGGAAARTRRHLPVRDPPDGHSAEAQEGELFDLRRMLERWLQVLKSLVARTGIPAIELDWLWATHKVRKQLPEELKEIPEASRLVGADLQAAIAASSSPGAVPGARIARTRDGAAACIRFNIEELATRASSPDPALTTAREVFVGPARAKAPYRPRAPIDEAAEKGFQRAWELSQARARPAAEDGRVDWLWKDIFRCGLHKAALRLLPRKLEEALLVELFPREDPNISKGRDEP